MSTLTGIRPLLVGLLRRYGWPVAFLVVALGHGIAGVNDLTWGNAHLNPDVTRMYLPITEIAGYQSSEDGFARDVVTYTLGFSIINSSMNAVMNTAV